MTVRPVSETDYFKEFLKAIDAEDGVIVYMKKIENNQIQYRYTYASMPHKAFGLLDIGKFLIKGELKDVNRSTNKTSS